MARSPTVSVARASAFAVFVILAAACSTAPSSEEPFGSGRASIINGSLDTTHQAVVFVGAQQGNTGGACTGTFVKVDSASKVGWVLTAAHCVTIPPVVILQGDDYTAAGALRYDILDYASHPSYTGQTGSSYDFAMIRVLGVDGSTPVIPALTPAEDTLNVGTPVVSVGYGRTTLSNQPADNNSLRRRVNKSVGGVTSTKIGYSITTSGICQGDSGGPMLVTVGGGERVAGVHSYVTGNCDGEGWSGRVSAADAWIQQQLAKAPPAASCDTCTKASRSGAGACAQKERACLADPACKAYVDCLRGCSTAACQAQCEASNPLGVGPYVAFEQCPCSSACTSVCSSSCNARFPKCGWDWSPRGECATCVESQCCSELQATAFDGAGHQCLAAGDAPAGCGTNGPRTKLGACIAARCSACGVAAPDGGSPRGDASSDPAGGGGTTTTTTTSGCASSPAAPSGQGIAAILAGLGLAAGWVRRRARVTAPGRS